MSLTVFSIKP